MSDWLEGLQFEISGRHWTIANGECLLGVVLLIKNKNKFVVVKKAEQIGYSFSSLYALPGGVVVREASSESLGQAITKTLKMRATAECGIPPICIHNISLVSNLPPTVTRFMARGENCYVMVLMYECETDFNSELSVKGTSIDTAFWVGRSVEWSSFAPANRVLLGGYLWHSMSEVERQSARIPIVNALLKCSKWALELGLPRPIPPWEQQV